MDSDTFSFIMGIFIGVTGLATFIIIIDLLSRMLAS